MERQDEQAVDFDAQIEAWRRQLLDTSKRNRLINSRFGNRGVVRLYFPSFDLLWAQLVDESRSLEFPWPSSLLDPSDKPLDEYVESAVGSRTEGDAGIEEPTEKTKATLTVDEVHAIVESGQLGDDQALTTLWDKPLDNRFKRLALVASESLSEQGVHSLFMAFGFLRWYESVDSDIELISPLLLVPVNLSKGSADSCWELSPVDDEILPNYPLIELLRREFTLELPTFDDENSADDSSALASYLSQVEACIADHPRWQVDRSAGIGIFAFQKISMWMDLRKNHDTITEHPICRSMMGDRSESLSGDAHVERDQDQAYPPESSYLILDCDSSQMAAVQVAKQGAHLVLDGPPGTGKSQTIANIIADSLAEGKTVLFVSEKAAALEVVKRRLDQKKIGAFCLECHSHKSNKKAIIEELGSCLKRLPETYPPLDDQLRELQRTRDRLNSYVRALHLKVSRLSLSPFVVHGRLAQIRSTGISHVSIESPFTISQEELSEREEAIAALVKCSPIVASGGKHPWRGVRTDLYSLTLPEDLRFHFGRAAGGVAAISDAAQALSSLQFLKSEPSLDEIELALDHAEEVIALPIVPKAWALRGLAKTAEGYCSLRDMTDELRILVSGVSQYCTDRLLELDEVTLIDTGNADRALRKALPSLPRTVREQCSRLPSMIERLERLGLAAKGIVTATASISESLAIPLPDRLSVSDAETLGQRAKALAELGEVRPEWFDPTHRNKCQQLTNEAKQVSDFAAGIRGLLSDRLHSLAFAPVSRPLIENVLQHSSWFRRLGGSWRRSRQDFGALYIDPPRRARRLLDDAYQLRRYQEYAAILDTRRDALTDTCGWNGDVDFDWDGLLQRLKVISNLPSEFQNADWIEKSLGGLHHEKRRQIGSSADELLLNCDQFRRELVGLQDTVDIQSLPRTAASASNPLEHMATVILEMAVECREQHARVCQIARWLKPEQDSPIEKLDSQARILAESRVLWQRAESMANELDEVLPGAAYGFGDWESQANLGEKLVNATKRYDGHLPPEVIAAISDETVHAELGKAAEAIRTTQTQAFADSLSFLKAVFPLDSSVSTDVVLKELPARELERWLRERTSDVSRMREWVDFTVARDKMERLGLCVLRDEILAGSVPCTEAIDVYRKRFYMSWLAEAYRSEPTLRDFDLHEHSDTLDRFREVDQAWIAHGFTRVRTRLTGLAPNFDDLAANAPESSEAGVLLREANKRRRHLPIRKLFARIPNLLLKIKPCLMMSPLAVSTYLDTSELRFDVVIFDEASQVRPHDAVSAIYRGSQLIVAGDQKQLPPTNFFERLAFNDAIGSDDDEDDIGTGDFESILDICATLRMPRQRLKWHYRSRRESLIAFSNRHFYDDELITFPSIRDVEGASGVELRPVRNGRWNGAAGGGVNRAEATELAKAVMRHVKENGEQTLGVITMNQAQQMAVLEEIERLRRASRHNELFFSTEKSEPFFVKNLENVQGDERDVIFLGIGYAKNDAGVLHHNFGPLNRQGGERRLNVAVTRARESLIVFSSINADDIDLSRTNSRGAKLLRAYLDFAQRGPEALVSAVTSDGERGFDSVFEEQVARALAQHDLQVRRQIGCGGFRIDLALVHPERPGRYVLGIECDGASYHSSATARDRDRLRQEVLENLGWRIVRIWSTDWIRNPQKQIEKVLDAYRSALAAADASSPPQTRAAATFNEPVPLTRSHGNGEDELSFASIDDVPFAVIGTVMIRNIETYGAMPLDELLQATARKLGFQRTGARIRSRLLGVFKSYERNEQLVMGDDNRVRHVP
ncbi:MAG: DUF4011 domain-containing protein [Phycisphaeraceae bacterium]